MTALPALEQPIAPELAPYWEAAARGVLVVPRCVDCQTSFWYPRPFCPRCAGDRIAWTETDGTGTVYSCTVITRGDGAFREAAPYVLAYVELAEGIRILTNIEGEGTDQVQVGSQVVAQFAMTESGQGILRFRVL